MVDPIEIKLDEIDAKIDQIAYAPKYKPMYEIDELMKTRPPAGFLDTLIKGATGGSRFGGALAGGLAAGGLAGGILVLADVISGLTKESKIMRDVQSQLTKAVSLLVDLVLLPFLPLIYGGIIMLYSGIVGFGTWWKDVWETLKKEGLIGLVKLGLVWVMDTLADWQLALTEWLFSDKPLASKVVDLAIALFTIAGGFFSWLGEKVIGVILDFIFGEGSYNSAKQATINILTNLLDGGIRFVTSLLDFIFGAGTEGRNAIDFTINLIKGAGDWLWNILAGIYNVAAENVKTLSGGAISVPVIPTTAAPTTASESTNIGGSNTFEFNGLTPEGLEQKVFDILRQFSGGWLNL